MKNSGFNLYSKAKKVILGGNMLFSKKPEITLPGNKWPSYFTKAKKIYVWDLNKRKYIDMMMYVGHNILGYSDKQIDETISKYIKKGNLTSLNCPEEVFLAQKLIKLHPWSGMAKFTRSGGEANAVAIRIARAATKKDHIAICGYHGWHDWYLSVNLKGKNNLKNHLLPGLSPYGVPNTLKNQTHPFKYGDLKSFKKIIKKFKLAAVIMEVGRSNLPDKKFLMQIRKLTFQKKIILIFDECTSGFRRNLGGMHITQKVYPDICMLGKALGNGYAINAIIGKKEIMNKAKSSFISSTFWSERIGFVAALKTLEIMQNCKSWTKITKYGNYLKQKLIFLSKKYNLPIEVTGIESILTYNFKNKKNLYYKTYISQEMLKKNYLVSNTFFLSIYHDYKIIDKFIKNLDTIFSNIKKIEIQKKNIKNYLDGAVCWSSFARLNN